MYKLFDFVHIHVSPMPGTIMVSYTSTCTQTKKGGLALIQFGEGGTTKVKGIEPGIHVFYLMLASLL